MMYTEHSFSCKLYCNAKRLGDIFLFSLSSMCANFVVHSDARHGSLVLSALARFQRKEGREGKITAMAQFVDVVAVNNRIRLAEPHVDSLLGSLDEISNHISTHLELYRAEALPLFPLNARTFSQGRGKRLVRCVGYVQEVEPALSIFQMKRNAYFHQAEDPTRANASEGDDNDDLFADAQNLYLVPIPGCTSLYPSEDAEESASHLPIDNAQAVRRVSAAERRIDNEEASIKRAKRRLDCDDEDDDNAPQVSFESEKGAKATSVPSSPPQGSVWMRLNLPHAPVRHDLATACVVTIVGGKQTFRPGEVIECFGFLDGEEDAMHTGANEESDELESFSLWQAFSLPGGLVNRLTAVHSRLFAFHPNNGEFGPSQHVDSRQWFESERCFALSLLTEKIFLGDELAAEYFMLHAVSRVLVRSPSMPVGDVPLYLWTGASPRHDALRNSQEWERLVRLVAPVGCAAIDLEKDRSRLVPVQDHARNVLTSGSFQVAAGTNVIVFSSGREALTPSVEDSLFHILHKQTLKLDFTYFTAETSTDINVLVVSPVKATEQESAVLRVACCVAWQPTLDSSTEEAGQRQRDIESGCLRVRNYLQAVRSLTCTFDDVNEEINGAIASDLARMSQIHPDRFNRDPVVHNNTVNIIVAFTRLFATTFGRTGVTYEDYSAVLEMERRRCDRL